jgi:hypothetical protein
VLHRPHLLGAMSRTLKEEQVRVKLGCNQLVREALHRALQEIRAAPPNRGVRNLSRGHRDQQGEPQWGGLSRV